MLSSAFYAVRDPRAPARVAGLRVAVSLLVGGALMFPFDTFEVGPLRLGAVGLGLGTSLAAWLEYVLLRRKLGRALGPHGMARGRLPRLLAAGLLATAAGYGGELFFADLHPVLAAVGTLLPFGAVYLAATRLFGLRLGGGG